MLDAGGGGGGGIIDAVETIGKQTANFASAAAEGHFAVSPRGGEALLQAINDMRDWINGQEGRLYVLEQPLPLGESHGAQTMKPYVQQVASDHEGFLTMLRAFGASLDKAAQGIQDAMNNYHKIDSDLAKPYTAKG